MNSLEYSFNISPLILLTVVDISLTLCRFEGEHVDYNDGFVLPFALPFRTIIVGSKSSTSSNSRIVSVNMNTDTNLPLIPVKFEINDKLSKGQPIWANYIKGTVYQYLNDLPKDAAFDAVVWSNVPMGSGLSSSAALE